MMGASPPFQSFILPILQKISRLLLGAIIFWSLTACSTTDQQVEGLIEQLAAHEIGAPRWQQAVDELADIGRPAARQLIAHLNPDYYLGEFYREYRDEREKIRTGAARVLGRIKPRGAAGALRERIGAAYTEHERLACLWAIGEIGFDQDSYDALKAQLKDANPRIRLQAAIGILKMDEEDGYDHIQAAIAGDDETMARLALEGLEESSYFGVPLLTHLVHHSSARRQELEGVRERVKQQLVAQLNHDQPSTRQRTAWALGQLGDQQTSHDLAQLLDDRNNLVRFNAAAALAILDDSRGIDFLFISLESQDPILRTNAVKFLTQVQQSSGTVEEQLVDALLHSQEPLGRAGAAQVLGQAQVGSALHILWTATEDDVPEVRYNAVIALGRLRSTDSRSRLQALVEDRDPAVSYYAQWALLQLGQG